MGQSCNTCTSTAMINLGNTMLCMMVTKKDVSNLVIQSHEYVVVMDSNILIGKVPFVKLCKVFNRTRDAYDEWLRLIGKLCRKEYESKFFLNASLCNHLANGNVAIRDMECIVDIAMVARKCFDKLQRGN